MSLSSVRLGVSAERGVQGMVGDSVVEPDVVLADEVLGCDDPRKLSCVLSRGVEVGCAASLYASTLEIAVSGCEATMEPIVVKLYYMPAIFSEALKNVAREPLRQKIEAVSSLMRFLTRVLDDTRPMPGKKGKVVERNVLFARATVRSEGFKQNPIVLDKLKIPAEWSLYKNRDIINTF